MKNFPSALIKQQSTKNGIGNNWKDTLSNIGSQALSNIFGGDSSSSKNMDKGFEDGYVRPERQTMIDEHNILSTTDQLSQLMKNRNSQVSINYNTQNGKPKSDSFVFEDPFKISSSIFSVINNYKYMFGSGIPALIEGYGKTQSGGKEWGITILETVGSPSLFNPYNTVSTIGITENIPLVDRELSGSYTADQGVNTDSSGLDQDGNKSGKAFTKDTKVAGELTISSSLFSREKDLTDCSIRKLVELSTSRGGEKPKLGLATYRYIDFMYCKDLGKIPNNRLITLRKFPGPIGDNIFTQAYPHHENTSQFKSYPDIGRLITWFDNEDNKLEDICRYNYEATWKEFTSEIQIETSKQRDDGFVNQLANLFSPQNNVLKGQGFSGNVGALSWGANLLHIPILSGDRASSQYYDWETLGNYDRHRIYEPPNRIWDTHKYEGRLKFNQDINLTFRYKLRSYDNINPKSALLDLLGNIMVVTYRRGSFWGGESKIIGPQGNNSVYETADGWINWSFDQLGGIWERLKSGGGVDMIQGWLSNLINMANEGFNKAAEVAESFMKNAEQTGNEVLSNAAQGAEEGIKKGVKVITGKDGLEHYHFTDALKGMIKDQLGRPAIYAMNSLLTGENVGPWHLTIGNPRNPIMSIGNLIMTNSEVTHTGPLGIDDFPTELIVKVTLKHGRPRDAVEIQKMYTKGISAIYRPMNLVEINKYWANENSFPDVIAMNNIVGDSALKKQLSAV